MEDTLADVVIELRAATASNLLATAAARAEQHPAIPGTSRLGAELES